MNTSLWKKAFDHRAKDSYEDQRRLLRDTYVALRTKTETLVANISADLRQYTIHDITHLDALWGVGSEIVGADFDITPTEAFILGGSFLLHDAGMCLAAYPGGLAELRTHRLWSSTLRKFAKNPEQPLESELAAAIAELLRSEHANRARELPNVEWRSPAGIAYHLIENVDLRQKFANAIGEISASHWWSHEKLASSLDRILPAPPPFPTEWRADLLKVAAVLRVADAAHIDERRAPGFAWALRSSTMNDLSNLHWSFQNRLTQPERRDDALHYSSTSDFLFDEAESWWLANDTLRMVDRELRSTDVLLADLRNEEARFAARRVANIESTTTMVKSLRVRDWIPIDTNIKISDVPSLIRNLGGDALYGNNPRVPLRELMQNAADSIRLKTEVLPSFKTSDGRIQIEIGHDADGLFLHVVDNGIGMTRDILGGPFLDFGNSGWSTDPVFLDYPNANPQKLNMVGKFGIGFFSTFMLGDKVEVTTRRFDKGFQDTLVLSFSGGVGCRPIMRQAVQSEWLTDGGTKVKVWVKNPPQSLDRLFGEGSSDAPGDVCRRQFPLSDIDIHVTENVQTLIPAIDWKNAEAAALIKRITATPELPDGLVPFLDNLRPIHDDEGNVVGRLFIAPTMYRYWSGYREFEIGGVVTSRGFAVSAINGLYGVVEGEVTAASRFSATPKPTKEEFHRWLEEQARLISKMGLTAYEQISCASIIHILGGDPGDLNICECDGVAFSKATLEEFLKEIDEFSLVEDYQLDHLEEMNPTAIRKKNLLVSDSSYPAVFSTHRGHGEFDRYLRNGEIGSLEFLVLKIVHRVWNLPDDVFHALSRGGLGDERLVGKVDIATTEQGVSISVYGKKVFKGMTIEDLNFY